MQRKQKKTHPLPAAPQPYNNKNRLYLLRPSFLSHNAVKIISYAGSIS
jgi:hypothetical protein